MITATYGHFYRGYFIKVRRGLMGDWVADTSYNGAYLNTPGTIGDTSDEALRKAKLWIDKHVPNLEDTPTVAALFERIKELVDENTELRARIAELEQGR